MAGRLMLLDSASLYFRAFYGVPDSLKAPDGTVVNAVRGLLDFVATLTTQYHPDAVVACWDDDWRPAWRVDLMPSYKTHRVAEEVVGDPDIEETPDLLSPQVPIIAEALGLIGIPVVGAMGAEADDIIGTLAPAWDGPVDVVTGDRDLFQLVDDAQRAVRVLYTARGVGNHDVVDDAWIRTKYGSTPHQLRRLRRHARRRLRRPPGRSRDRGEDRGHAARRVRRPRRHPSPRPRTRPATSSRGSASRCSTPRSTSTSPARSSR